MELKKNDQVFHAYLSMGANLGDRSENLGLALGFLQARAGLVEKVSSVYETEPWGFDAENSFLNVAVCLTTGLSPFELLDCCLNIEKELGRVKHEKNGIYVSRPIDIDLLFYGQQVISASRLQLPHPFLHLRKFVLVPLNEIVPGFRHPLLNETIETLLSKCTDSLEVKSTGIRILPYS